MSNLATYNAKFEPLLKQIALAAAQEGIPFAAIFEVPTSKGQVTLCCGRNGEAKSEPLALVFALFEAVERECVEPGRREGDA